MLAAIVFTDTVGFSERVGRDEEGTLELVRKDLEIMTKLCVRFEGRVVKSTGDGLMMLFSSAVQAVNCALEAQRIFTEQARSSKNALMHRIGVHLGDVLVSDGDALGDGVNIAARLEQESEPGGICMSQTVYEVVKGRLFLQAAKIGDLKLKNIAEPISAYKVAGVAKARKHKKVSRLNPVLATSLALVLIAAAAGGTALYMKSQQEAVPSLESALNKPGSHRTGVGDKSNRAPGSTASALSGNALGDVPGTSGAESQTSDKSPALKDSGAVNTEAAEAVNKPADAQPPDSNLSNGDQTSAPSPSVTAGAASKGFDDAWMQFARRYDYTGMSNWVRDHADQVPAGQTAAGLQARYDQFASLMDWFRPALSKTSPQAPLQIGFHGNPGTAYQRADGRVIIELPNNRYTRMVSGIGPILIASIARGLLAVAQVDANQRASLEKEIQLLVSDANEHKLSTNSNSASDGAG
jgi:class 3 adenylate cyclase